MVHCYPVSKSSGSTGYTRESIVDSRFKKREIDQLSSDQLAIIVLTMLPVCFSTLITFRKFYKQKFLIISTLF